MEFIQRVIYNLTEVHPFHTLIVHFPIALSGAALFFILLALVRRNATFEFVAFANIALASVSTLAAGLTGMMDNLNIYEGQAPNANWKMILAVALFIVTAFTTILRWRRSDIFESGGRGLYVSAYLVSFLLASVLGFLGGVILYGF